MPRGAPCGSVPRHGSTRAQAAPSGMHPCLAKAFPVTPKQQCCLLPGRCMIHQRQAGCAYVCSWEVGFCSTAPGLCCQRPKHSAGFELPCFFFFCAQVASVAGIFCLPESSPSCLPPSLPHSVPCGTSPRLTGEHQQCHGNVCVLSCGTGDNSQCNSHSTVPMVCECGKRDMGGSLHEAGLSSAKGLRDVCSKKSQV